MDNEADPDETYSIRLRAVLKDMDEDDEHLKGLYSEWMPFRTKKEQSNTKHAAPYNEYAE